MEGSIPMSETMYRPHVKNVLREQAKRRGYKEVTENFFTKKIAGINMVREIRLLDTQFEIFVRLLDTQFEIFTDEEEGWTTRKHPYTYGEVKKVLL